MLASFSTVANCEAAAGAGTLGAAALLLAMSSTTACETVVLSIIVNFIPIPPRPALFQVQCFKQAMLLATFVLFVNTGLIGANAPPLEQSKCSVDNAGVEANIENVRGRI